MRMIKKRTAFFAVFFLFATKNSLGNILYFHSLLLKSLFRSGKSENMQFFSNHFSAFFIDKEKKL